MAIDWSATAAWIVLGANVISPIIVAVINNHHQRKMFLLRERESKRAEIINGYLSSLSAAISDPCMDTLNAYSPNYGLVTGYIPDDALDDVDQMHVLITRACRRAMFEDPNQDALQTQYAKVRKHFYFELRP